MGDRSGYGRHQPARANEGDDERSLMLFDPRPAILWKNDPQAQRHGERDFRAESAGRHGHHLWAKSDIGTAKLEFLQNDNVLSTMEVPIKAGMNRLQWDMLGPAPPASASWARRTRRRGWFRRASGDGAAGRRTRVGARQPERRGRDPRFWRRRRWWRWRTRWWAGPVCRRRWTRRRIFRLRRAARKPGAARDLLYAADGGRADADVFGGCAGRHLDAAAVGRCKPISGRAS